MSPSPRGGEDENYSRSDDDEEETLTVILTQVKADILFYDDDDGNFKGEDDSYSAGRRDWTNQSSYEQ